MTTVDTPITILYVGVSSAAAGTLELTNEAKAIDTQLRKAELREYFKFEMQWEAEARELPGLLLRFKPQILHFSGHGTEDGELSFRGRDGESMPADAETIASVFGAIDSVRCVVLNACYSAEQALLISEHVEAVIGLTGEVSDSASKEFSMGFYEALAYGQDIASAFALGRYRCGLSSLAVRDLFQLFSRADTDPAHLVLGGGSRAQGSRVTVSSSETHDHRSSLAPRQHIRPGDPRDIEHDLVLIPGGRFLAGSAFRTGYEDEWPRHAVELEPFSLARTPVTNEQYARYLAAHPEARVPAHWNQPGYDHPVQPVVGVSWDEARRYCEWANLTLPTEMQWEYACRSGTQTSYWLGDCVDDLERVGWYRGNSDAALRKVGEKPANPWGLLDMHGNVWEWCFDSFGPYGGHQPRPGDGLRYDSTTTGNRVLRGGSWCHPADNARSAFRYFAARDTRHVYVGFRPAKLMTPSRDE
jgi:formylglycine-generating enzyme required for sulfatase activity